jgi:hypothetical protein
MLCIVKIVKIDLMNNLQPSCPSRKTGTGVVGDAIKTKTVDALASDALVDVGRANVVFEPVRTLALEHFTRVLEKNNKILQIFHNYKTFFTMFPKKAVVLYYTI